MISSITPHKTLATLTIVASLALAGPVGTAAAHFGPSGGGGGAHGSGTHGRGGAQGIGGHHHGGGSQGQRGFGGRGR